MKVLIADDEDYTREGLIEAVDWEKFGIDEIMQAVNGAEAARIARSEEHTSELQSQR